MTVRIWPEAAGAEALASVLGGGGGGELTGTMPYVPSANLTKVMRSPVEVVTTVVDEDATGACLGSAGMTVVGETL